MPHQIMCGGGAPPPSGSAVSCASVEESRDAGQPPNNCQRSETDDDEEQQSGCSSWTGRMMRDAIPPPPILTTHHDDSSGALMPLPTPIDPPVFSDDSRTATSTPHGDTRVTATNAAAAPRRRKQAPSSSRGGGGARRRLGGLVQRTHSPKDGYSPLSRPVTLGALDALPAPPPPPAASFATTAAAASTTANVGRIFAPPLVAHGKKRRRSNGGNNSGSNDEGGGGMGSSGGGGGRTTTFFPLKKRRKGPNNSCSNTNGGGAPPSTSSSNPNSPPSADDRTRTPSPTSPIAATAATAAAAQDGRQSAEEAESSSPVVVVTSLPSAIGNDRTDGSSSSVVEVRSVAPTVRGIREAARILNAATTTGGGGGASSSLAYPLSPTSDPSIMPSPARNDREGILSFPTETVYALTTCVTVRPLLRSSSVSSEASSQSTSASEQEGTDHAAARFASSLSRAGNSPSLNRLLRLKGMDNGGSLLGRTAGASCRSSIGGILGSHPDPPLLYLHSPSQAREFVQFTKPKTFVVKSKSSSSCTKSNNGCGGGGPPGSPQAAAAGSGANGSTAAPDRKVPAVTFSESREVLDRITAAFWPGPVVIYGRAKMRRCVAAVAAASGSTKMPTLREDECSGGSVPERAAAAAPPRSSDDEEEVTYAPILPASVLIRGGRQSDDDGDDGSAQRCCYVGMKCPSHPLARRVLEEVYCRNNKRMMAGGGGGHRRRCRSRVVLGFNATVPVPSRDGSTGAARQQPPTHRPSCPTKAREVCAQLLSARNAGVPNDDDAEQPSSSSPSSPSPTTVHVLNGEDKREIFAAPTCQFGPRAFVSLVIDDEARTVRIQKSAEVHGRSSDVLPKDVYQALRKVPPSASVTGGDGGAPQSLTESAGARVIAAVLQRWKVVEENITL